MGNTQRVSGFPPPDHMIPMNIPVEYSCDKTFKLKMIFPVGDDKSVEERMKGTGRCPLLAVQ